MKKVLVIFLIVVVIVMNTSLVLSSPPSLPTSIYGRVSYPDGSPAVGVEVVLIWFDSDGYERTSTSKTINQENANRLGNPNLVGHFLFNDGFIKARPNSDIKLMINSFAYDRITSNPGGIVNVRETILTTESESSLSQLGYPRKSPSRPRGSQGKGKGTPSTGKTDGTPNDGTGSGDGSGGDGDGGGDGYGDFSGSGSGSGDYGGKGTKGPLDVGNNSISGELSPDEEPLNPDSLFPLPSPESSTEYTENSASPTMPTYLYGQLVDNQGKPISEEEVTVTWEDKYGNNNTAKAKTLSKKEAKKLGDPSLEGYYFFNKGQIKAKPNSDISVVSQARYTSIKVKPKPGKTQEAEKLVVYSGNPRVELTDDQLGNRILNSTKRIFTENIIEPVKKAFKYLIWPILILFIILLILRHKAREKKKDLIIALRLKKDLVSFGHKKIKDIMTKEVITIDQDENLFDAANLMISKNINSIIVISNEKPIGIITETDFLNKVYLKPDYKVIKVKDVMSKNLTVISDNSLLFDGIELILSSGYRKLPVVRKGKLVGIVTISDLLDYSNDFFEKNIVESGSVPIVKTSMQTDVLIIREDSRILDVCKLMIKTNKTYLLVQHKSDVGSVSKIKYSILTVKDLLTLFQKYKEDMNSLNNKQLITQSLISVKAGTSILQALKIMLEKNFRRLPVVSNEEIEGVFDQTDLLESVYLFVKDTIRQIQVKKSSSQKNNPKQKSGSSLSKKVPLMVILLFFIFINMSNTLGQNEIYEVTPQEINTKVKMGDFLDLPITIINNQRNSMSVSFSLEGGLSGVITIDKGNLVIEAGEKDSVKLTAYGHNISSNSGSLAISGDINEKVPITINVTDLLKVPVEALVLEIEPISDSVYIGSMLDFKVGVRNLLSDRTYDVKLYYSIDRLEGEDTYKFEKPFFEEEENVQLATSLSIVKEYEMPKFIKPGRYVINVKAEYLGLESSASRTFNVVEPFWDHVILGILPVRWILFLGGFLILGGVGFFIYRKRKAKKKRYVVKIDMNTIPTKPGPRMAYLGYVAETNKKTYFELELLKTHTLIAGSTGGGKTVSAEVIVEEALQKGVSVIVFDPTAQWSGFLRKNTDKKMFSLYPRFGMKKTDARAFNGNVRQILNAREIIDVKKYIRPGEINVFTINKLDPEDADILVSNTIREVFHANLPESPELKLMVIFDEVHRLLPKFGGSGQGFIQIERAAREFRKWGVGLMLISQVLSDFVGETKANINTEIQMRTRDQGDLDRIKSKYGGYMLQSLLKSSTGTGMLENSSYNKGNPYFVAFKPLLHEHARLSDKELENYNKYNDVIDELDFQINELEKEKIDVFDLRLELKMALDKVKSGSFNMVDIYLEGLKPRLKEQWTKLGKEPPKRKTQFVTESELREEFQKAQEARRKYEQEQKKKGGDTGPGTLTFKNGKSVSNKKELMEAIEAMTDDVFKQHVNDQANEIADWLIKVDKPLGEKISKVKDKEEVIHILAENQ